MQRLHLFEFEDQGWLPHSLRELVTQTLRLMINSLRVYEPTIPLLARALARSGTGQLVDLCSGSGGPWQQLYAPLREAAPGVEVVLTDKFPQPSSIDPWAAELQGITYHPESVDASIVPASLPGVRTVFTGFHHFDPATAAAILRDAVANGTPIAVFESTQRTALNVALAATVGPVGMMAVLPWLKPFRWTHLAWTYLLPVGPLVYAWDGAISNVRTYTPAELQELAGQADPHSQFEWEVGQLKVDKAPAPITYLLGLPRA